MPTIIVKYPILTARGEKVEKSIFIEFAVGQIVIIRMDTTATERMIVGWYVTEQGVRYDLFPTYQDRERYYYNIELELVEELV